jgi:hypothetical protein
MEADIAHPQWPQAMSPVNAKVLIRSLSRWCW